MQFHQITQKANQFPRYIRWRFPSCCCQKEKLLQQQLEVEVLKFNFVAFIVFALPEEVQFSDKQVGFPLFSRITMTEKMICRQTYHTKIKTNMQVDQITQKENHFARYISWRFPFIIVSSSYNSAMYPSITSSSVMFPSR